jgi:multidrug resistance efflux pump
MNIYEPIPMNASEEEILAIMQARIDDSISRIESTAKRIASLKASMAAEKEYLAACRKSMSNFQKARATLKALNTSSNTTL